MCEPTTTAAFTDWLVSIAAEDAAAGAVISAGEAAAGVAGVSAASAAAEAGAIGGAAGATQAAALPWGAIASGAQALGAVGTLLAAGQQPALPAASAALKPADTQDTKPVDAAAVAKKRKTQLGQFGNSSTLLTGPSGIDTNTSPIGKATLLGQ